MRGKYSTGVETVDRMGEINFTGNIIPPKWFGAILRDNGKPYLLAICILSELCFWYRPREIRDERSGFVIGYKKRFREDLLQKDYQQLATFFGESKSSVKAAMDKLEKMGLIRRIWRNLEIRGMNFTNVLYIDLNPDRIQEITFSDDSEEDESVEFSVEDDECFEENSEKGPASPVNSHMPKFLGRVPENFGGGQKFPGRVPENNHGGGGKYLGTNTESTTKNNTEITSNLVLSKEKIEDRDGKYITAEDIDEVRERVKQRVSYSALATDRRYIKENLDELVELMVELYVTEADVKISGTVIPYQLIRKRLDSYDQFTMEYVLNSLRENHTRVGNMKKYLLATIYNAPATHSNRIFSDLQENG